MGPRGSAATPAPTAGLPSVPRGLAGRRLGCVPHRLPCARLWRWAGGHHQPGRAAGPVRALGCLLLPRARCVPHPLAVCLPANLPPTVAFPADVACQCRRGFVGDGTSVCNGKLLDVLAATADFSTFYGVCRGPGPGWEAPGSTCPQPCLLTLPDAAALRQRHPTGSRLPGLPGR